MEYNLIKHEKKRQYKRHTADEALKMIINQIEQVNSMDDFVYFVDKAVLFGSYLDIDKQTLGDIDIAIYLSPKRTDVDEMELNLNRSYKKDYSGAFCNRLFYGREEVCKFIKNRKSVVSLHAGREAEIESLKFNEDVCYIYLNKYAIIYDREEKNSSS